MQKFIFVQRNAGISKKGQDYDLTEVSDGINSFVLSNDDGIGKILIEDMALSREDEFMGEVHISSQYGSIRGKLVAVSEI